MTESLMGFTLGVLIVVVASLLWKAQGTRKERERNVDAQLRTLSAHMLEGIKQREYQAQYEERLGKLYQGFDERIAQAVENAGSGASDAAIAQLAARITAVEKQLAAQDLTILDTAERVAHKLQDRRRKRDQAELGEIDDAPHDPAQLLAEARRAYGVTAADPAQLSIIGGE